MEENKNVEHPMSIVYVSKMEENGAVNILEPIFTDYGDASIALLREYVRQYGINNEILDEYMHTGCAKINDNGDMMYTTDYTVMGSDYFPTRRVEDGLYEG